MRTLCTSGISQAVGPLSFNISYNAHPRDGRMLGRTAKQVSKGHSA